MANRLEKDNYFEDTLNQGLDAIIEQSTSEPASTSITALSLFQAPDLTKKCLREVMRKTINWSLIYRDRLDLLKGNRPAPTASSRA